jgi:hypothetical protein
MPSQIFNSGPYLPLVTLENSFFTSSRPLFMYPSILYLTCSFSSTIPLKSGEVGAAEPEPICALICSRNFASADAPVGMQQTAKQSIPRSFGSEDFGRPQPVTKTTNPVGVYIFFNAFLSPLSSPYLSKKKTLPTANSSKLHRASIPRTQRS